MPILYTPSRLKASRIVKRQDGGVIPVYGTYQVQHAQQAPYNPAGLLAKYQTPQAAPGAKAAPEPAEWRNENEIEGLIGDSSNYMAELEQIEGTIRQGLSRNPDFFNTEYGAAIKSKYDHWTTHELHTLKKNEELYKDAVSSMKENKSDENWVYDNGKGYVYRYGQEGKLEIEAMSPLQLKDEVDDAGRPKWERLTYGELAKFRSNYDSDSFIKNPYLAQLIGDGIGMAKVRKDYVENAFNSIGYNAQDNTIETGGQVIDGETIEKMMRGDASKSNERQLINAVNSLKREIKHTPAWNTLESEAWQDPSVNTAEDASKWIDNYFLDVMYSKLIGEESYKRADILDRDAIDPLTGEGGPAIKLKELSEYNFAPLGIGTEVDFKLEAWLGKVNGQYKTSTQKIKAVEAKYVSSDINAAIKKEDKSKFHDDHQVKFKSFNKLGSSLGKLAVMSEAQLASGKKLSETTIAFEKTSVPADEAMVVFEGSAHVVTAYVNKGNGEIVQLKDQDKYNKEVEKLTGQYNSGSTYQEFAVKDSDVAEQKYIALANAIWDKHYGDLAEKIEKRQFYTVEAVFPAMNSEKDYVSSSSYLNNLPKQTVSLGQQNSYYYSDQFKSNMDFDLSFNRTNIFIPVDHAMYAQAAGANVYTQDENVRDVNIIKNLQGASSVATRAELQQAINKNFTQ
jgi:hypothetical protein